MAQATFEEISAQSIFSIRNRDIAGFTNPSRAIFAAIRELVENSLDAAESQKIPPEIYVRFSFEGEATKDTQIYKLRVEDNGSGIQPRFIPVCFWAGALRQQIQTEADAGHVRFRRKNGCSLRASHYSSASLRNFLHGAGEDLQFQVND